MAGRKNVKSNAYARQSIDEPTCRPLVGQGSAATLSLCSRMLSNLRDLTMGSLTWAGRAGFFVLISQQAAQFRAFKPCSGKFSTKTIRFLVFAKWVNQHKRRRQQSRMNSLGWERLRT